jgi:hypothetical protein
MAVWRAAHPLVRPSFGVDSGASAPSPAAPSGTASPCDCASIFLDLAATRLRSCKHAL